MFYLTLYRWNEHTHRFDRAASYGFASREFAERAMATERAHLERTHQNDVTCRLTVRTPSGEHIDAPDEERDAEYADRAALGRMTGEGGL